MLRAAWNDWRLGAPEAARRRALERLRVHAWPAPVLEVLATLRDGGHQAWLVGGTVRDALLGREPGREADVTTDRLPNDVLGRFPHAVPTGIRHGTVTIVTPGGIVECTTLREEGSYADARRPDEVRFTTDAERDLDRRDLTVNALAFDPVAGVLLDPHGGALDVERRRLRAVGDPIERFREDALRPFRVARFAAVLDFAPDGALLDALAAVRDAASGVRVEAVAAERVRAELERLLAAPSPSVGIELLRRAGLLERWLPELAQCVGVTQNRFHAWDVYEHSLRTCDAAPAGKPRVRWAALLHDVGKPPTKVIRNGDATFYEHDKVGAALADRLLERLRFPTDERKAIVHLVREHMFGTGPDWSDAALRRWLRRVGPDAVADLFDLRLADAVGNGRRQGFPVALEGLRARLQAILDADAALDIRDLAVDGRDVMRELEMAPGPDVGRVLASLLEEVIEHPEANTRDHLLAKLRERRM
jgi:tRNA nucleotidyltransferase (CCA-adding enzyme)